MTHAELVKRAAVWLRRKHAVIITEMAHGAGEEADAIGWTGYGASTLVECKATRTDFIADGKKLFRKVPRMGMGRWRYFMTPPGLLSESELPESWGLIEAHKNRFRIVVKAVEFREYARHWELQLMVSALRRPDGLCVKRYTYENKGRATIGCAAENSTGAGSVPVVGE